MRRAVLAALLLALAIAPAAAQTPVSPEVRTVLLTSQIVVDGVPSEPAWLTAQSCSTFTQSDPVEGARPTQRTEVRVLYDKNALYISARMFDSAPDSIISELSRRDGGTRSDGFIAYLDPYHDRRSGYYFGMNVAGTQYDGTLFNDAWSDDSWDGVWQGKSKRDAQGWTMEMRIPFSQLRFARAEPQTWGINFLRRMGRGFEDAYLVPRPKKSNGFVSLFPHLVGLQNVNPTNAIEITPYATGKAEFLHVEDDDPFNDGSRMQPNLGGDLRMPFGSKLTLSATVNPDFGQVEVDPAVVNLSDVETFFPEKRPFFVEGSSIFDAGQQGASDYWGFNYPQPTFFYSRRIGHAPEGQLPPDAEFADVPQGTTILGAAKLSGKLAPSMNFGMLHTITAHEQAEFQRADLSRGEADVEPLTYYGVGRVLKEFHERRNGLGFMATFAHRDLEHSLENQFNHQALTGVVDGWHFIGANQGWVLSGWAGGSFVSGTKLRMTALQTNSRRYLQRPDATSFDVDPNATSLVGGGARVWLNKEKGNWFSNSAVGFISPRFETNDLGFQSRADLTNAHIGAGYKWTDPTKNVKKHDVAAAMFGGTNFDGDLTAAGVWTKGFWWFTNNWTLDVGTAYNPETVAPRRSRGGPLMLKKQGYELNVFGDTDGSRKRYYNVGFSEYLQPDENSFNYSVSASFVFKPAANVRFEVGPEYETARDGAFYVTTIPDAGAVNTYGNRYVFARLDQQTLSANLRMNVSFTPTMSLQFYGQPLIATGRYSDYRELARPRSLDFVAPSPGSWTYDPTTGQFDRDGSGPAAPVVRDFNSKSLRGNAVFRWEYRPGSAFYLVWTQQRTDDESIPDFNAGSSFRRLVNADPNNIFLAKVTYYLTR
jgi:hypothetical protein